MSPAFEIMGTPDTTRDRSVVWKDVLAELLTNGVKHGDTLPTTFFEERLGKKRDTIQFSFAISDIRRALEKKGMYLTALGQKGEQYVLLPPECNQRVMAAYSRRAVDALRRGVILGTNTPLSVLSSEDRRRHETILEKMQMRLALMNRCASGAR